ncbi:UNVERIFIED_CONTAM: hypothetical protein GTU68_046350, partial [Idotea baltica]|nr:hypothetical protein [Idotea baltica]
MKDVKVIDWGLIDYQKAWDAQTSLHKELVDQMRSLRAVLCEHPHVYTLGKSGKMDHLLWTSDQLRDQGVQFYKINRGGDITYHGPGQIVVYPIFDLDEFYNDVHRYVRSLEEVVIRVLDQYGVVGERMEGFTGVWLHD